MLYRIEWFYWASDIFWPHKIKQLSGILNTLNSDYYNKVEDNINNFYVIKQCVPGECLILDYSENDKWYLLEKLKYDTFKINKCINFTNENYDLENIYSIIRNKFIEAVKNELTLQIDQLLVYYLVD